MKNTQKHFENIVTNVFKQYKYFLMDFNVFDNNIFLAIF